MACFCLPAYSQTADFFLVNNPAPLTIYDKFEQSLTDLQKKALGSPIAFRIIESKTTLGDQITEAAKVSRSGETFFVLRNGTAFAGQRSGSTDVQVFKQCRILGDTVVVTSDNGIFGYKQISPLGLKVEIASKTPCLKMCAWGEYVLVLTLNSPQQCIWIKNSDNSLFSKFKNAPLANMSVESSGQGLSEESCERLKARFSRANELYQKTFDHFNARTGESKSIPRWNFTCDANGGEAVLSQPYANNEALSESTKILVRDIESLLLGKSFSVTYQNGVVRISPSTTAQSR